MFFFKATKVLKQSTATKGKVGKYRLGNRIRYCWSALCATLMKISIIYHLHIISGRRMCCVKDLMMLIVSEIVNNNINFI